MESMRLSYIQIINDRNMANNNINLQNAKDLKKSFAGRLHNARLMRGLSMQQLCDMMGNIITKQTLSRYENGVMLPKSDIVIAFAMPWR